VAKVARRAFYSSIFRSHPARHDRTFGWLSKSRRLSKDYEYRTENSEAIILIAATRLMLARLA